MTQDVLETKMAAVTVETAAPGEEWTVRGGWVMCWQIPVFLASLIAWTVFLLLQHHEEVRKAEDPREAARAILRAFKQGRYEEVRTDGRLFIEVYHGDEMAGVVALAAGQATFRLAEALPQKAGELYRESVELLKCALAEGLEGPDVFTANDTLARALMQLGEYGAALDVFTGLEEKFSDKANTWRLLRARAEFGLGKVDAAEATVERLRGTPGLAEDRVVDAILELAEGYVLVKRLAKAEDLFRGVLRDHPYSGRTPEAHFGLGYVLMVRSAGDRDVLTQAMHEFETAAKGGVIREELGRKAAFFVGECLYAAEEHKRALETLREVALVHGGTPEGIAAGLRVAAILVAEREFGAAREALARVLAQVPDGARLESPYVTEAEINSIWQAVLRHYLSESDYEKLEGLNRETSKISGDDIYLYQQASLHRHRGDELRAEAQKLHAQQLFTEAARTEMEASSAYREAARLFVRIIAGTRSDRRLHSRALQQAADTLTECGDYAQAVVYYRMFLDGADEKENIQWTYIRYARALQALGRDTDAIAVLDRWIKTDGSLRDEGAGSPVMAEAVFTKARSYLALRDLERAEKTLVEIVDRDKVFQPNAELWRRALGELAYVLYLRGKFAEAVPRLDEVLRREGVLDVSRFTRAEMTYWLADAWRSMRSEEPGARGVELRRSADRFAEVRKSVRDENEVPAIVRDMIRQSTVAEAECRFELGEYAEALKVWEFAAEKYLELPDGVGSLFGAAACLHRLGETERAAKTAERARWSLEQLRKAKPDAVTPFMEDAWGAMILWSEVRTDL